ncbi:hypothetical protein [Aneurinibacillus migulanus]|uniref:hypothetical protein n=1 Tax=Aneurinibacillus migulanus TaxID=47500 RepID=UPI001F223475|nr:hypothetical protein [Aneurinibacillus migulanus]
MINRHIFVVGGKKRRKSRSGRKKTRWPFFCRSTGCIHPLLFSESPPSSHASLSKYQV